jgi:formamidopyrimidine-DNA glycosylase
VFKNITKSEVHKLSGDAFVPIVKEWKRFTVSSKARGKEMILTVTSTGKKKQEKHFIFKFGMSGCFLYFENKEDLHKHAHVIFEAVDGTFLCFVDQRRFGSWEEVESGSDWGSDRGPDPIDEYPAFCKNVAKNIEKKKYWNAPICEVLLLQELFNGIGNYLRAEICHEFGIDPFKKTNKVLAGLTEETCEDHQFLQLCRDIPLKFFQNSPLNSNYSKTELMQTQIKVYGRSDSLKRKDSKGRMVWWRSESTSSQTGGGEENDGDEEDEEEEEKKRKKREKKKLEKKRKKKNSVVQQHEKKLKEIEGRAAKMQRQDTLIIVPSDSESEYEEVEMTKAEQRKLEKNLRSKKKLYNSKKSQRMAKRK